MSAERRIVDPTVEDLLALLGLDYRVRSAGPTSGGYFAVLEGDGRIVYLTESGSSIIAGWRDGEVACRACDAPATRTVDEKAYCERCADRAAWSLLHGSRTFAVSKPIGASS